MKLLIALVALVLIGGGLLFIFKKDKADVAPAPTSSAVGSNPTTATDGTTAAEFTAKGVKITDNYYEYSAADYAAARAAHRPIFLYFYANWCPTCAAQEPIVKQLMSEISDESKLDNVIAFRVNYNDNATDKDEEKLANEFGVRYQHTMFVLNQDGQTNKKFLGQTDKETLRAAFAAVAQ